MQRWQSEYLRVAREGTLSSHILGGLMSLENFSLTPESLRRLPSSPPPAKPSVSVSEPGTELPDLNFRTKHQQQLLLQWPEQEDIFPAESPGAEPLCLRAPAAEAFLLF